MAKKATGREKLVQVTKELLWEQGYAATSPYTIVTRSGVGQGSFYHHFPGKRELAAAALESVADEVIGTNRDQLSATSGQPARDRLMTYLSAERDVLRGCRLGRIAYDPGLEEPMLRAPSERYFHELRLLVSAVLQEMRDEGELPPSAPLQVLAMTAIATVQGGYILARIHGDSAPLRDAVDGLAFLLNLPLPDVAMAGGADDS
ncbi:MAG: TetR/AcrR family transcriptional regulator [Fibrella sp.]|nr:TetR/AcrR family transcriptional regulator [Armatimonadota bacterium]